MAAISAARSRRRLRPATYVVGCCLAAIAAAGTAAATEPVPVPRTLSLGAMPTHSLVQLEAFWAPLASYLSERLGCAVRFGTSSSLARFQDRLRRKDFDVVFVQATDFANIARSLGYVPLVRIRRPPAVVFFVRPDAEAKVLADLRGQSVALPPVESDVYVAAQRRLQAAGLAAGSTVGVTVQAQENACLQQVVSGRSAAGAASEDALSLAGARKGVDFRVIDDDARVEAPVVLAAPTITAAEREALGAAFVAWPTEAARRGGPANLGWLEFVRVPPESAAAQREGR